MAGSKKNGTHRKGGGGRIGRGMKRALRAITPPEADTYGEPALRALFENVRAGLVDIDDAMLRLKGLPFEETECATIDHHRRLRKGFCEVIYCAGKTPGQVAEIAAMLAAKSPRLLGTRASIEHFAAAHERIPELHYDELARVLWMDENPAPKKEGVVVIAAGTSDLSVAEEAAITLEVMGHRPTRIRDVGVAGLQRLLKHLPTLMKARVVIAVAGMEGALPSVVAGLIPAPLIAVPTSVGYGSSFGGVTALLSMLNSCASGIAVVNIDNGFGAGYMAAVINGMAPPADGSVAPRKKSNGRIVAGAIDAADEEGGE